jgi:uncharacterized SAM-binding protein YcdF (DUF218 family)
MLFALKKIVSGLLYPSALICLSLCAGLCCLAAGKRTRSAVFIFSSGLLVALITFSPWASDALLRSLERQSVPYSHSGGQAPEWILILGRGVKDGDVPETSRVSGAMYARLMEAARIARKLETARIIVSLSGKASADCKTGWWSAFCLSLNLPSEKSIILAEARDTEEEIRQALHYIGSDPFILVTSAAHMPRAMLIAGTFGGKAIPAPCDFEGRGVRPVYNYLIPSSQNLGRTEEAVHEYLGLLWFRLTHALEI